MNWPYLHIIINHFPIILAMMGAAAAVLSIILYRRGIWLYTVATLTLAGLSAYPTVFTGDNAEEVLEEAWYLAPGVLHAHEEAGELALWVLLVTGVIAAYAWWRAVRRDVDRVPPGWLRGLVVVGGLASAAAVGYAALEGGEIVHEAPILQQTGAPAGYSQPPGEAGPR